MQISISGALGDAELGGPMFNIVPRTGGNNFSGTVFGSGAGEWAQGSNIDDELRRSGSPKRPRLIKLWDVSFALVARSSGTSCGSLPTTVTSATTPSIPGSCTVWTRAMRLALGLRSPNS